MLMCRFFFFFTNFRFSLCHTALRGGATALKKVAQLGDISRNLAPLVVHALASLRPVFARWHGAPSVVVYAGGRLRAIVSGLAACAHRL